MSDFIKNNVNKFHIWILNWHLEIELQIWFGIQFFIVFSLIFRKKIGGGGKTEKNLGAIHPKFCFSH